MKRFLNIRTVLALATAAAILGLAGAWAVSAVRAKARYGHEVAKMTHKLKTVCVGRFLIDLPEEARVVLAEARIDGFDIETFAGETDEEFWARVARREANIRSTPDRLGGNRNMESVNDVHTDGGLVGKIFVHSRTVTEGTAANGLDLEHYHYENVAIDALVHAKGVTVSLSAERYDPDLTENMPRLVAKLMANPNNRIPSEPGYCIDKAFFRDPLRADQNEQVTMMASLPSHPDVQFILMLLAGTTPDEKGLLERNAESKSIFSLAERMRVKKLRAAPRIIGGLTGDELVERFAELNNSIGYSFWWEVNGTQDNVFAPHFSFTMNTGKGNREPVTSSLSEGAALALWDKITSSIRVRPTVSAKAAAAAPAELPVGATATAGQACPQSGWWQCGDGGAGIRVLGGRSQYFRAGSRMPQALLLPPQSMFDKVRGVQRSFESSIPTLWRLTDKRSRPRKPPGAPLADAAPREVESNNKTSMNVVLGTVASTGAACPASGWWFCEEENAVDGTRWFARGSLLPPATMVIASGTARSRNPTTTNTIQRRTTWRLVRHAEMPVEQLARPGDDGDPSDA